MKCPKCGGEIMLDDVLDNELSFDTYREDCAGTCVKCSALYQWEYVYELSNPKVENLKQYG